jgi:hypothetical protein
VLAYNMKRVMQIMGIRRMIKAIRKSLRALLTIPIARVAT